VTSLPPAAQLSRIGGASRLRRSNVIDPGCTGDREGSRGVPTGGWVESQADGAPDASRWQGARG
jgi:hypothetical protein